MHRIGGCLGFEKCRLLRCSQPVRVHAFKMAAKRHNITSRSSKPHTEHASQYINTVSTSATQRQRAPRVSYPSCAFQAGNSFARSHSQQRPWKKKQVIRQYVSMPLTRINVRALAPSCAPRCCRNSIIVFLPLNTICKRRRRSI